MGNDNEKPALERQIEENLRRVYQQNMQEDVPDRFKELLAKLKARDSQFSEQDNGK
ncbi:NepR family anti-sigma factor [Halovulum marinum]|uniref:NepR family anti-sigma factor n=1 Tax=Halovulum marinum TaxID=2662447 RepID=UPI001F38EDBF|nr:NepR family anti-sigma factor [Halovulum marinum]